MSDDRPSIAELQQAIAPCLKCGTPTAHRVELAALIRQLTVGIQTDNCEQLPTITGNRIVDSARTVVTKCARCGVELETQSAAAFATVLNAHQERCFVVGDEVEGRHDDATWERATILRVLPNDRFEARLQGRTHLWNWPRSLFRRIPRPEQAFEPVGASFSPDMVGEWIPLAPAIPGHDGTFTVESVTPAGRMMEIADLARKGTITSDQARELLTTPSTHAIHHFGGSSGSIRIAPGEFVRSTDVKRIGELMGWDIPFGGDQLDVLYDGNTLRELLVCDEIQRRGECTPHVKLTPVQRAAVSAHWSAALRAKVEASKEHERLTVVLEQDCEDDPWRT